MTRRIGFFTGGGDAPGLNAVLRAFVKRASGQLGWEVVGIEDAYMGLLDNPRRLRRLTPPDCQGLLHRGGTVLGTTNRGDPFELGRAAELAAAVRDEGMVGMVAVGGDGTQRIALRLMKEHGIPFVGVPKTIDNDLSATDRTFGFQSAVEYATDALDRLHTTAESHERVLLLEVMGRDAGHIALHAGIAGGADVILLPEIPYDPERVAAKILRRTALGRPFSIVVIAEGAVPREADGSALTDARRKARLQSGGGAARVAMAQLEGRITHEMRTVVLGHLQRGGSPVAYDRLLATAFGVHAAELVEAGRWGEMVCLQRGDIASVTVEEAVSTYRLVDVDGDLVRVARAVGVELGG